MRCAKPAAAIAASPEAPQKGFLLHSAGFLPSPCRL
jgi:hypothetical protein